MKDPEVLRRQIRALQRRIQELDRRAAESSPLDSDPLQEYLEELSTALEELRVSEEELRVSNDALISSQQALERERQQYWELFHEAPDAYLVTDSGGVIREANRAAAELLGRQCSSVIGKPLVVYLAEEDRKGFHLQLSRLREECGRLAERELHILPRNGPPVPVAVTSARVREPANQAASVRWLLRDISERKRAEEQRRQLAVERTAREEAEAANRTKADFLAVMSHELRTPLTAIMGYSELLQMGIPEAIPEEAVVQVERIDGAARHLLQIIEEILTFSRVEAGREGVRLSPLDLGELAAEAIEYIRPLAQRKGLRAHLNRPDAPVLAVGDRGKVRQILINLLSNAVKFTPDGEVAVEVGSHGGGSCVQVRDTGVGIAPEHLERIWEPFWQVQGAMTRDVGGTGIGLGGLAAHGRADGRRARGGKHPGEGKHLYTAAAGGECGCGRGRSPRRRCGSGGKLRQSVLLKAAVQSAHAALRLHG